MLCSKTLISSTLDIRQIVSSEMSAAESEKKSMDEQTTAQKEPVDQTSDVTSNEPPKENGIEKPIVNEALPQLAEVDDRKLPKDELLFTDSHNTQSQLITDVGLSQADELLNSSILTSTDDLSTDYLVEKTAPAPVASNSQDIGIGPPTSVTVSNLELVDEAVSEELVDGSQDVKQDNVAASEVKSQEDEVMECDAPVKEKPQVITLDDCDNVAMKDDTKENKTKKLENTQVRDYKVVGFTPLDNFGIPIQQDHFDKFGLNTKVCVMYKKHFERCFAMDPRRRNAVIVNLERMRNFVNMMDEERMKKYVYDAKLKTWMSGKLETADKRVLPVNLPGHHVPGYLKDGIAENVKETVHVQKQEKARQLMEKVGTTESDPSQIRAPFLNKKLRGGSMGDSRPPRQQREGKSTLTLGGTGVYNPKPTRAQKRLQRRLVAKENATAATSAPPTPTPTTTDSAQSEVVTEAGGPSFAPIVFSPTTLAAEVTASSASGTLQQPNDEGNEAIAIDNSVVTPVKSDQKKNDGNRHKHKEKRTESFPQKPKGDDRNRHGRGPQHSDRRGRVANGPRRDRANNRRPEPSNNRKRVRSPPRRGDNVFTNEKRVRVWDNQGSRSAYSVEPLPFARSLFQVPYHPPSLMGADSYASSRRAYPDFSTVAQSPAPPFGTAQSGFPVYSESPYGSSARNDKYGQSASFGGAQAYQQTPPSGFVNDRDTLSEIRRIERELATIRQHQHYGNTGSSSASTRSSALPVSPPKSFTMYGSSNSAFGGSASYNYSGSSDKQPPKRFSNAFGY
ncbi:unnamed protein product, partial [Mesorhabditis belari]|uniref:Uncharacterized protein n=1 Tax=Mesorhabditis belari TaxID=2138241 RepID=A0AAF3FT00_9BILA